MSDEDFMKVAIVEAKVAKAVGNLPFGAVIACKDKIVGRGGSREVSDSDITAHAEMQALGEASRQLGVDLSDCTIYCSGEPCNMCAAAILHANVGRIVIAASRADLPQIFRQRQIGLGQLAADASYHPNIERGQLKNESLALFGYE